MALIDDKNYREISDSWELILDGAGIITNMSIPNMDLHFRFDVETPSLNDASRTLYGRSEHDNKDSFINENSNSKIYGKAKNGVVKILVTREIV